MILVLFRADSTYSIEQLLAYARDHGFDAEASRLEHYQEALDAASDGAERSAAGPAIQSVPATPAEQVPPRRRRRRESRCRIRKGSREGGQRIGQHHKV